VFSEHLKRFMQTLSEHSILEFWELWECYFFNVIWM